MPRCCKCNEEKKEEDFWKRPDRKRGVCSECKECAKKRRTRLYKEKNLDFRAKRKIYYQKNREKLCKRQIESQKGNVRYRKYQNQYLIRKKKEKDKKFLARAIVCMALKGEMIFRPIHCSQCLGTEKIEAHHCDYNKPLDIIWVCYECHRKIHKSLKEEKDANY